MTTRKYLITEAVFSLLVFQGLVSVFAAAPPSGGSSAGKILFSVAGTYKSMNSDGSQVAAFCGTQLAYDPWVAVSSKQYAGKRWMLVFEETGESRQWCDPNGDNSRGTVYFRELFAYRSDGVRLQLTDLSQYGLKNDASWSSDVSIAWSNDNADSFFSIRLGAWEVTNGNYVSTYRFPRLIVAVNLTGHDLDEMATLNANGDPTDDIPLIGDLGDPRTATDPRFEIVLNWSPVIDYDSYDIRTHGWDPSGTQLLYTETDELGVVNLYRRDFTGAEPQDSLVLAGMGNWPHVDWSPYNATDGSSKIAVASGGSIRLVNPDGTGLIVLRSASSKSGAYYYAPYWSPDGKYLAYRVYKSSGSYVAKFPAAGGKEVTLTSGGWVFGWTVE